MKNNYNPFIVPDKFFEDTNAMAVAKFKKRRRAIYCSVVAMAVAAIIVIVPIYVDKSHSTHAQDNELAVNKLASMYEYDIFLQVNF